MSLQGLGCPRAEPHWDLFAWELAWPVKGSASELKGSSIADKQHYCGCACVSFLWLLWTCLLICGCACVSFFEFVRVCVSPSLLLFCCCARVSFFVVVHASYFLWLCMGLLFLVVHVSWPPLRLYSTCLLCFCQYGSGLLLTM